MNLIERLKEINRARLKKRKDLRRVAQKMEKSKEISILEALAISRQNKATFARYKGILKGEGKVVVLATGKTLNDYTPMNDAIHIGVNGVAKIPELASRVDFYFAQDYGVRKYFDAIKALRCRGLFFGRAINPVRLPEVVIPEFWIEQMSANLYYTGYPVMEFRQDLTSFGLPDFYSVIFSAFAFALWLHPREIYLVGCDCSNLYCDGSVRDNSFVSLVDAWKEAKEFSQIYYPDVEVCSINPVGLKGIFKDLYL